MGRVEFAPVRPRLALDMGSESHIMTAILPYETMPGGVYFFSDQWRLSICCQERRRRLDKEAGAACFI